MTLTSHKMCNILTQVNNILLWRETEPNLMQNKTKLSILSLLSKDLNMSIVTIILKQKYFTYIVNIFLVAERFYQYRYLRWDSFYCKYVKVSENLWSTQKPSIVTITTHIKIT